MLWLVDTADPTPMYLQVARVARQAWESGELRAGERLPPARELATSLGLNMHTVLRGYQELRDEGIVELRRGRGAVIRADVDAAERLRPEVDDLITSAHRLGVAKDALIALIHDRYAEETP